MVRSVVELDCMMVVTGYTSTFLYSRRVAAANFVANRILRWRIHLVGVPPKSCMLCRIVINKRASIRIWACTRIIRSSLLTWPSWWALSIHALLITCNLNMIIHDY